MDVQTEAGLKLKHRFAREKKYSRYVARYQASLSIPVSTAVNLNQVSVTGSIFTLCTAVLTGFL